MGGLLGFGPWGYVVQGRARFVSIDRSSTSKQCSCFGLHKGWSLITVAARL